MDGMINRWLDGLLGSMTIKELYPEHNSMNQNKRQIGPIVEYNRQRQ